jgi:ubiquinone/menaquinone biosynthesis C-methylase UbiE
VRRRLAVARRAIPGHLAKYFGRVIATDESAEMIAQAPRDPRIEYRVAEAEDSGIESHSVELVTVASAIH